MAYQILCDGLPLYDYRDEELILEKPRCKVAVNTCGEASFIIHSNHPHYNDLRELASLFEVRQDGETIFRGRMTSNSRDFKNAKEVDIEGVMAFFNDSIVRPFNFPKDFENGGAYEAAAASGNVVAFFLGWLIDNHNMQVQDFQKLNLGTVTVKDPNNYIARESEDYAKTWETLESKLFGSALGGYLCARYEADGTYIDYLADFTETNTQKIVYGENLLDLTSGTDATETFTAVLPLGKENKATEKRLTIAELPNGYISEDIYKRGDYLYKKSAVEAVGLIFAPISDSTFDDISDVTNLRKKGVEFLNKAARFSESVTYNAFDLHLTDKQIESFRIYKYVEAFSKPHGQDGKYILSELDIDIENPQNTKITAGSTQRTLIDITRAKNENAVRRVQIASSDIKKTVAAQQETIIKMQDDIAQRTTETGVVEIVKGTVNADYVNALKITVQTAQISGKLTASQINGKGLNVSNGIFDNCTINENCVVKGTLTGSNIHGGSVEDITAGMTFNRLVDGKNTGMYEMWTRKSGKFSELRLEYDGFLLGTSGGSDWEATISTHSETLSIRHTNDIYIDALTGYLGGYWTYGEYEIATTNDIALLTERIKALEER